MKTGRDSSEEKVMCTGSNSTHYRLVLSQDKTGTSRVLVNGQVTVDQLLLINLEIPYQPDIPSLTGSGTGDHWSVGTQNFT